MPLESIHLININPALLVHLDSTVQMQGKLQLRVLPISSPQQELLHVLTAALVNIPSLDGLPVKRFRQATMSQVGLARSLRPLNSATSLMARPPCRYAQPVLFVLFSLA